MIQTRRGDIAGERRCCSRFTAMRICAISLLLALVFSTVPAVGQSWDRLYIRAMEDLEAGRWDGAIAKLQESIRQNPRSGHSMRAGVTTTVGYFPYFLLGKAYYHSGRHDEALKSFAQENANRLPARMKEEIAGYETAIEKFKATRRLNDFRQAVDKAETARGKGLYREAAAQLQRARNAHGEEFEKRGLDKLLVQMLDLDKKQQAEKEKETSFATLLSQATQKENEGDFRAAKALLAQASQVAAGRPETTDLENRIAEREARYASLRESAAADEREGRFSAAIEKLNQAAEADPKQFEADNLGQIVDSLSNRQAVQGHLQAAAKAIEERAYDQAIASYDEILQKDPANATALAEKARVRSLELLARGQGFALDGSFDQALTAFGLAVMTFKQNGELVYDEMSPYVDRLRGTRLHARWLEVMGEADPQTFEQERLAAAKTAVRRPSRTAAIRSNQRPVPAPDRNEALRQASYSALSGPPQEAIRKLEQVRASQKTGNAELESATAIAYARLSLLTPDPEQRNKLRAKARDHFKMALSINPGYRVNSRLVSPQIVKLFSEVRAETR